MTSFRDWVVETSSTTGTGAYALSGSPPAGTSYFTFRQRYSNGEDEVCYWVVSADRAKWEKNRFGTLTYGSPDTLSRNVVESTNGDAAVSWVGGDGPLRIYVVPDAAAEEFAISMGLGTTRPGVLKFGIWADQDDAASGIHSLKFFDGTDDIAFGTINPAANKVFIASTAMNFPAGYIQGFTYSNNGSDATNDIDVAAGSCSNSTGVYPIILSSTLTKRLDANWAVGSGNGGILSGSAANVDYNIWAIARSDTGVVDVGFETTANATPTLPSNYTYYRKIGWFKRVGGTIVAFDTYELEGGGLELAWKAPTLDIDLTNTLTTSRRTDAVKVPLNFSTIAHLNVGLFDGSSGFTAWITCPDTTDAAPSSSVAPLGNFQLQAVTTPVFSDIWVRTSATGTIAARATLATVDNYRVSTQGFKWSRR